MYWGLGTRAIGWEYRTLEREETVEFFRQHEKIKRIRDNFYRNVTSAAIVAIIRWIHDHQIQPLELILLMLLLVSEKTVELSYLYRWISYGTFSVWLLQRKMQLCAKYMFSFSSVFDYWQQILISLLMLGVFLQENFRSLIFGIFFQSFNFVIFLLIFLKRSVLFVNEHESIWPTFFSRVLFCMCHQFSLASHCSTLRSPPKAIRYTFFWASLFLSLHKGYVLWKYFYKEQWILVST